MSKEPKNINTNKEDNDDNLYSIQGVFVSKEYYEQNTTTVGHIIRDINKMDANFKSISDVKMNFNHQ